MHAINLYPYKMFYAAINKRVILLFFSLFRRYEEVECLGGSHTKHRCGNGGGLPSKRVFCTRPASNAEGESVNAVVKHPVLRVSLRNVSRPLRRNLGGVGRLTPVFQALKFKFYISKLYWSIFRLILDIEL